MEFVPPANRREALHGHRKGQHSIRVNDQYRVCFRWTDDGPLYVELSIATRRGDFPDEPATGEMLVEEFLTTLGILQAEFAQRSGVTYHRLNEIANGRRGISVDTALRFSKALGTTAGFWLIFKRVSDMYEALRSPQAGKSSASGR